MDCVNEKFLIFLKKPLEIMKGNIMYDGHAKSGAPMELGKVQNGVVERLVSERNQCAKRLKDLDEMLAKLDKNPEIAEILNQLSKITHF